MIRRHWATAALLLAALPLILGCQVVEDSCVAEGTWILTPSGAMLVESLQVGDSLYSLDLTSGALVPTTVTAISRGKATPLLIRGDSGAQLEATGSHLIHRSETKGYRRLDSIPMSESSLLSRLDHAGVLRSERVRLAETSSPRRVYDLSVASAAQNYLANGFLVHNKSFPPPPQPLAVTDLRVLGVETHAVELGWTAPDGQFEAQGTAPERYRFSLWAMDPLYQRQVELDEVDAEPGDSLRLRIDALARGTEFGVTLESLYEEWGRWSQPSNSAEFSTLP